MSEPVKCEDCRDLPPRSVTFIIGAILSGVVVWGLGRDARRDMEAEHRAEIAELRAGAVTAGYAEWVADPKTGVPVWHWKERP